MSVNRLHSTRVARPVTAKVDLSDWKSVTSMSLRDCVFLYNTIGGCGKITLSSGWFWIKYQFFNSISLMFGATGLPVFGNKWQNLLARFGLLLQSRTSVEKLTSAKVLLI